MSLSVVNSGWVELESAVEAFEAALVIEGQAALSAYLPDPEHPLYRAVLRELLCIDLEHAWRHGQEKRLADYLRAYPQFLEDPETMRIVAMEEFRWRAHAGEHPRPEEYAEQFGIAIDDWPTIHLPHAAHVSGENGCGPLAVSSLANPAEDPISAAAGPAAPQLGEEFAGFHLLEPLGAGAFAQVYLARQDDMAGRLVVLKISTDGEFESHTLAKLQHTNIVPIYSVHRQGRSLAVCMPYFGKTTLADLLRTFTNQRTLPHSGAELVTTLHDSKRAFDIRRKDRLSSQPAPGAAGVVEAGLARLQSKETASPDVGATSALEQLKHLNYVDSILWIGGRLADGLAHAHERGILHRDLKPANVLLTDDGQPMLLDFNLAEDTSERLAASGASIGGTLPYMSPEQLHAFEGHAVTAVDARTDLYSLGVILYELLAGRHPFATPKSSSRDLIPRLLADRREQRPRLRGLNPHVSPAVEAIIGKCLEPDPNRRYQCARDLQTDLDRQLAHLPLKVVSEPSLRERASKWRRRHPRIASLTTLGIAAAVLLTGLGTAYMARGKNLQSLEAAANLRAFELELREAQGLLYERQADERQLEEGIRLCTAAVQRYDVLRDSAWFDAPGVRSLVEEQQLELRDCLGEAFFVLARAKQMQATAAADAAGRHVLLGDALAMNERAESCYGGRLPRALLEQRAGLMQLLDRETDAKEAQLQAEATQLRGDRDYYLLGHKHAMEGNFRKALPLLEEATRQDPRNFAAWFIRGNCQFELLQDAQAVGSFNVCVSLRPHFMWSWHNRGLALLRQRYHREAFADFDRAIELRPSVQRLYVQRARAREQLQQYVEASADLTAALAKGPTHNYVYFMRARVRTKAGDVDGARRDRAEGQRSAPTDEDSYVERGLSRLKDHPEDALSDFNAALLLNPRCFRALQNKAAVLSQSLHRDAEALRVMDVTLAWYPESVLAHGGRGVLCARVGRRTEALRNAEEALLLDTQPPTLYQAACIYALTSKEVPEDRRKAMQLLAGALRTGFGLQWVDTDQDLDLLRNDEEFGRLVSAARAMQRQNRKP